MAGASLQRWQREYGRVSVLIAPASAPLDVDVDVKPHLRIGHNGEDAKLTRLVAAAVGVLDTPNGWLGRSLITRTLRLTLDAAPPRVIYLPGPPTTKIEQISYRDADDNFVTVYDPDVGPVDTVGLKSDLTAEPALIWPDDEIGWPTDIKSGPDSFRVDYVTGYADADAIPEAINQWLLQRVGELYRDPEASSLGVEVKQIHHADRSLDNWRVYA
jgi:uncharacterized phiE125 gp8 family phage protein